MSLASYRTALPRVDDCAIDRVFTQNNYLHPEILPQDGTLSRGALLFSGARPDRCQVSCGLWWHFFRRRARDEHGLPSFFFAHGGPHFRSRPLKIFVRHLQKPQKVPDPRSKRPTQPFWTVLGIVFLGLPASRFIAEIAEYGLNKHVSLKYYCTQERESSLAIIDDIAPI